MERNHFLDLYRAILTIFVLLYHLGLCESGFLAVCGFFTISGYLLANTMSSAVFDLKEYYIKRIKSLYIPLIVVSLSTVFVFKYIVSIPWVTLKQESLSVLLSYNNFFQIGAENNYFIRSDASPFTHMWYIAILIQIEIALPLIVMAIRKTKFKYNKALIYFVTVLSIFAFIYIDDKYGMANSYYNTIGRMFSFLIGYCVYYVDYFNTNKKAIYIVLSLIVLILVSNGLAQKYYVALMISVSILSGLFILLAQYASFKEYKIIDYICKISYFVYLVQYPVIYIIDTAFDYNNLVKILIEVLLIVAISMFYAYGLNNNKNSKIVLIIIIVISMLGAYQLIASPDDYEQMEELKKQLEINQNILANKQAEYLENIKDKQKVAINDVAELDEAINNIDETTKNTQVLLIGDSIMLGGSFNLDEYFNNYYCDAKGSRNGFLAYDTLSELMNMGVVGDYIVIHLGTNSGLELEEVEKISTLLDEQKVLWLTVTNGWRTSENPMLEEYCSTHENNYLLDWYNYSLGHPEYFIADGLHLSEYGRGVYDQFIFDNLKQVIYDDLLEQKEKLISDYNKTNNDTVSFYGNDLLINLFSELGSEYLYYTNSDYDYDSLYKKLSENKEDLCLSNTIFIVLDSSVVLTDEQIDSLFSLLDSSSVHIYAYNHKINDLGTLLDDSCLLNDGIHLNNKGNQILLTNIKKVLDDSTLE